MNKLERGRADMQKEAHVSEMESFHPTSRSGLTTDNFVSVLALGSFRFI